MNSVLSLLGLIYISKKLVLGEEVLNQIKKVKFLFIASDASDKTKERYLKKCDYYNIPYTTNFSGEQLAKSLGKANIKIIGIIDEGFTQTILNKLK